MVREADVIIVGAGLSGLSAAREVLDAGREPLVLEADDRVGGRILTEHVDGIPLELGAQWIGDTHHRMQALAAELGVQIYDQFEDGETTYEFAGEVLRGDAFHEKYSDELRGLERVLREIDRMADTVPVEAPWTAPRADTWDRITVGQWYDSQGLSPVASWRCRLSRFHCYACWRMWLSAGSPPSCSPSPKAEPRPSGSSAAPR